MADVQFGGDSYPHYDDYSDETDREYAAAGAGGSRFGALVNWAGAVVSIALLIGMTIWAWQLMMRDVTDVPVVRALEGPMRIAPEDPGGSIAENQGLAVNRLAEGAEAAPVPDQLVLAPPPVELAPVAPIVEEERAFENASAGGEITTPEPVAGDETSILIERLLAEAQPLDDVAPEVADEAVVGRPAIIPATVPGVPRSPRPMLRPASLVVRTAAPADAVVPEATEDETGFELASAELEAGTRLVQLGAYDSADMAREAWQRLATQFPDFFTARARVIEQATSGGQTFFRLRAHGFADLSASRRFCTALIAQGSACVPVTVR